jgi:ribosome-binding factor A
MAPKKSSTKIMRSLCAQVHPDDGLDPRVLAKGYQERKPDRKTRQLCSQVADTLGDVLAGQGGDDVLRSLYVVSVVPAPDASRLLVTVGALPGEGPDPVQVIEHLGRASARLRCEVAGAITRRRAPTLVYRFAMATGPAGVPRD